MSEFGYPEAFPVSGSEDIDPYRPKLESTVHEGAEDLLAIAKELGVERQEGCPFFKEDRCLIWAWDRKENIPQGIGEPVKDNQLWRVKPSTLLCALCTMDLGYRLFGAECNIETNPLSEVKEKFKCDCGSKGFIAVAIKCTKCGRKDWWGRWPKE